jgi:hypothetical protein
MTRQQRAVLGGAGGLIGLVALLVAILALRGDGAGVRAADSTTTSSSSTTTVVETTTTFDLRPETTTTTAAAARPVATTTTTVAPTPLPVVTASGAVLKAPDVPTTRTMDATGCTSLGAREGWTVECESVEPKGGTLIWLVEHKNDSRAGLHVFVFAPKSGSGSTAVWQSVLEAGDEAGTRWSSVVARGVDLSGDGPAEIAFGFRQAGTGILDFDVVEGPGVVVAHRGLVKGSARVSPGQLDTWARAAGSSSSGAGAMYEHDVVRWQDGAWRVVLRSLVAAADVPPSQF